MNPLLKYIRNLSALQRVLGDSNKLKGLVRAEALLSALVHDKKVPGISMTVLHKGKKFLQKGYGYADLDRKSFVDPQRALFRIASVSKPIAATALAHMVAEGKIELDASFYDYVPYFPKKKWDFTIRQLAGHTAGIRGYQGLEYGLNKPYTLKEGLKIFQEDKLLFEPGTDFLYNSFDWVLISLAMQEVSGIPFEQYVYEKVLLPLGMEDTFPESVVNSYDSNQGATAVSTGVSWRSKSDNKKDENKNIATFYAINKLGFRTAKPVNNYYKLAGGGYLSTSEDIAKLGQAYLDGRTVDQELRSQFLTSQIVDSKPTYYGLGWQVSQDRLGRNFYGHVGNGIGGYSNFFVYPNEQMVFAILINCMDPKVQGTLDEAIDLLVVAANSAT
ncbi:MAG: beta-lactamase family protein [Maribacter sp.]|nr:beta-lactamase family protein [Maribacter sp.]